MAEAYWPPAVTRSGLYPVLPLTTLSPQSQPDSGRLRLNGVPGQTIALSRAPHYRAGPSNSASMSTSHMRTFLRCQTGTPPGAGAPVFFWPAFASAYDGQFDSAFSQRFLLGRCTFLDRIVSIKLCHCGKNRNDELPAGRCNGVIVKPALDTALLCDDRETAIVDHPVIGSLIVTDF